MTRSAAAVDGGDRLLAAVLATCRADLADAAPMLREASARACFDALTCMAAGVTAVGPRPVPLAYGNGARRGADAETGLLDAIAGAAMAAHALDRDDVHWGSLTHPGSMLWPALLVVATRRELPLRTMLEAGALGYQVVARITELLGTDHRRSFHASTTSGTIAVAAAVSWATGHTEAEIVSAMSHAASTIGGTSQAVREHSRTALLHRAVAATSGTLAAEHARLAPAVSAPLDGPHGFAAATGIELARDRLGVPSPAVVGDVTFRVHPVNGFSHSVVDAALSLPTVDLERIRSVVVSAPAYLTELMETDPDVEPSHPAWHLPHIVALCLAGALPAPMLSSDRDPAVTRLRGLVTVQGPHASAGTLRAQIRVVLDDGHVLSAEVDVPHGHPADPLSDRELVHKAVALRCCTPQEADGLLDSLLAAEVTTDALVVPRGPREGA